MNITEIKELRFALEGVGMFVHEVTDDYILVSYLAKDVFPGEVFKAYPDRICPKCGTPMLVFAEPANSVLYICAKKECPMIAHEEDGEDELEYYYRDVEVEESSVNEN